MNNTIDKTIEYIREKQTGEVTGHDWFHTKRVYEMALDLAEDQACDLLVVSLASLLHDIEDWKFNGGDETAGPKAAKAFMDSLGVDQDISDHVVQIIYDLSYKGTEKKASMKTIEGMIVQDADRLDALGAIGIARTFAFGATYGNEIFNPEIEPRIVIDASAYKDKSVKSTTVNHFYEKLFNLVSLMNTEKAKVIAKKRHDYMLDFIGVLLRESRASDSIHMALLDKFL
ncbi:HD domain-containing protein [Acidaminobacter sp. JC074]|uniref:HD domain-containing protein n=1 Tax=Acidaminobacter sp. JC074 TaxID=2530199 RepID=UPI001F0F194E|nr:HD domain-containing protein [Acidaminobacter sp. JC074]MCH4886518.1 HD domain-containing protein [Acidaminobacter sp. JC074]